MSAREFDGVIIGAGHNALVLAGYMAKSGMSVAVLERGTMIGGGLATVHSNAVPNFMHEHHSQFHRNIPGTPWYSDLDVGDHGVEYIYPQVNNGMPLSDGRNLIVHADPEKTRDSFARINKQDGDRFLQLYTDYQEMARKIQVVRDFSPPLPTDEERDLLSRSKMGREFLSLNERSAYDIVHELFEDEHVRAFYLFLFSVRGYLPAPTVRGAGFSVVAMTYLGNKAMLPKGGSRSLAHALGSVVTSHGGRIFPATEVGEIIVRNGAAVGVETVDGQVFNARKFVVSSVDPHQTFLRFIGSEHVDQGIKDGLENYKYGVSGNSFGVLFALHAGVHEAPRYTSEAWDPAINESFNLCIGYETPEEVVTHLAEVANGIAPNKIGLQAACPTVFDPTRAPDGKHVLLGWQFAPYELKDGGTEAWDDIRDEYLNTIFERWGEYAPNVKPDSDNIIFRWSQTPVDTERSLINMREGDFHVGALIPEQLGANRPLPGLGNYRTPIEKLYLTGSATHPSGTITGAPGYNTAQVLARDLGIDIWWNPPNVREIWSELS
jgi:phytoene dehydrogenase-like protein